MDWLDAIYSIAESAMPEIPITDAIASACGTRSAMIAYCGPSEAIREMNYWRPDQYAPYFASFIGDDPWAAAAGDRLTSGGPVALDALLPPKRFMRSTMFNELMRPIGDDTARCLGLGWATGSSNLLIAVHRGATDAPFGREESDALSGVGRHLRRALRLRDTITLLGAERTRWSFMLESTGHAVLIVDSSLRILSASTTAMTCLDEGDGLRVRDGRVVPDHPAQRDSLSRAVRKIIDRGGDIEPQIRISRRSSPNPLVIEVLPAGPMPIDGALLKFHDPDLRRRSPFAAHAAAYGFTPAETALAKALIDGETLADISARRSVSRETLRTQLRALFDKAGVRRQGDLIRILS